MGVAAISQYGIALKSDGWFVAGTDARRKSKPSVADQFMCVDGLTCKLCGLKCHNAYNLKRHISTHTGERPFACPFCNQGFTQKSNMKMHIYRKHKSEVQQGYGQNMGPGEPSSQYF